jgi:hypothetical protein
MAYTKKYPSIAKDMGTNARFGQYVLTRILNNLGSLMEIFDTQAAGALLGLNVSLSSESYVFCDSQSCINMIKNENRLTIKNIADNEIMSDNEDDNASKSNDTSEYNSLSLSTDSEENEDLNKFINNGMEENDLSQSNDILL